VQSLYEDPKGQTAAFAMAALLALLALFTLGFKTYIEWRTRRNFDLAQRAAPELKPGNLP
jgi:ABC-type sulfate transport system permease subunit